LFACKIPITPEMRTLIANEIGSKIPENCDELNIITYHMKGEKQAEMTLKPQWQLMHGLYMQGEGTPIKTNTTCSAATYCKAESAYKKLLPIKESNVIGLSVHSSFDGSTRVQTLSPNTYNLGLEAQNDSKVVLWTVKYDAVSGSHGQKTGPRFIGKTIATLALLLVDEDKKRFDNDVKEGKKFGEILLNQPCINGNKQLVKMLELEKR
jgi:hypothetical protein